jgi:hypothetical protein
MFCDMFCGMSPHQSNYIIYPDVLDRHPLTQYSIVSLNVMTLSVSLKVKPNRTRPGAAVEPEDGICKLSIRIHLFK